MKMDLSPKWQSGDTAARASAADQPRAVERKKKDKTPDEFTTGSSHLFPPSLSSMFSPTTPSEGSRSAGSKDIVKYNTMVCALLVLFPVALAFGGLELAYMLDQQAEASLRSIVTIQHARPTAREVFQPTAAMEEVHSAARSTQPCPLLLQRGYWLAFPSLISHMNPAQEQGMFFLFLPFVTLVLFVEMSLFVLFRALDICH